MFWSRIRLSGISGAEKPPRENIRKLKKIDAKI